MHDSDIHCMDYSTVAVHLLCSLFTPILFDCTSFSVTWLFSPTLP